ncbi:MAG: hypothetical protein NXH78_05380 [Hyphomonadaceae bacterium]|nr:hypothetical protein [Hyphomonadaceae bacterium]
MPNRRQFVTGAAALPFLGACASASRSRVSPATQREMYDRALQIAETKIRGGVDHPVYKKPFVDAAFSESIFLWDTCFIASYAKYHQDRLPIGQALDNFYDRQEPDGYICREYTGAGEPFWPKDHPVATNPPLLAFAELELHSVSGDVTRLEQNYSKLVQFHDYIRRSLRQSDGLYISDAFGSGMDNVPRYPDGWEDDGQGIALTNLHPEIFVYDGLSPKWNRQGRSVDMSAQMVLFANDLAKIARLIGRGEDVSAWQAIATETADAINEKCWNEGDGFYYDLGYDQQIPRAHIGAYWMLIADAVPQERLPKFLNALNDPAKFNRKLPTATMPGDSDLFQHAGGYWRGSIWAPTSYMVIRGLETVGQPDMARSMALRLYDAVAEVYRDTDTFWENYAPDAFAPGDESRPDFCGWTAIFPITLWHEYIDQRF